MKTATFAIPLTVVVILSPPVAIANPSAESIPIGRIVEVRGAVQLKRRSWSGYRPTTVGTLLYSGDLLQPSAEAVVRVRCTADNQLRSVSAGVPSSINNYCSLPRPLRPQCPGYDCPRGNTASLNQNIPYILSPRRTLILTDKPLFRWNGVTGATLYTVRLKGAGWEWLTTVNGTEAAYTGDQPLQLGVYYSLVIETDAGRSSLEEDVPGLGFKLLDNPERRQVQSAVSQVETAELNEEAKALSLTDLYLKYGLKADAIDTLETLVQKNSKTPAVYQTLGELYWQLALLSEAEANYLKALELIPAEDIDGQASTAEGLGDVYTATGETDKAKKYLQLALTQYKILGDLQRVQQLENQLRELTNQK